MEEWVGGNIYAMVPELHGMLVARCRGGGGGGNIYIASQVAQW